jgi:hypothetical protein
MKAYKTHPFLCVGLLLAGASLSAQTAPSNPGTPGGPNASTPNPAGITPGAARPTTPPASGTTTPAPTIGTGSTTDTTVRPANPTTTNPPTTGTGSTVTPPTGTTGGTTGNTTVTPKPTTPPTGTPTTGTTPPAAMPPRPNENASDRAKEVTAIVQQFDANRERAMAERAETMRRLDAATTETEKQAILTQLRTETQAERDEQAKLGKQIREQLKGAGRRPGS